MAATRRSVASVALPAPGLHTPGNLPNRNNPAPRLSPSVPRPAAPAGSLAAAAKDQAWEFLRPPNSPRYSRAGCQPPLPKPRDLSFRPADRAFRALFLQPATRPCLPAIYVRLHARTAPDDLP